MHRARSATGHPPRLRHALPGSTRARSGAGGIAWVLALAVVLWIASTLGFVHRVVHAPDARAATASPVVSNASPSEAPAAGAAPGRAHGGVAMLFSHRGGTDDCRLYDQLAGGFVVPSVPFVVLPIVLPMARFHFFLGEAVARWVALFDARGPPATR